MTTEEQKKERKKEYLRNYRKDNYEFWKSHNMCTKCGTKDAYTLNGRSTCAECAEEGIQRYRDNSEFYKERARDRYNKLKAEHKCIYCAVQLPDDRKAIACEKCYKKRYSKAKAKRKTNSKARGSGNICYRCNKNQSLEGKKLCKKCYESSLKTLAKAQEAKKGLDEYWQRDNRIAFSKGEQK